jgi:serine/threonine-protein kinase PRP4
MIIDEVSQEVENEDLEKFLNEEDDDDEEKVQKKLEESKKRRQEILLKYQHIDSNLNFIPIHNSMIILGEDTYQSKSPLNQGSQSNTTSTVGLTQNSKNLDDQIFNEIIAEKSAIENENSRRDQYNTIFDIFSSSPTDFEQKSKNNVTDMKTNTDSNRLKASNKDAKILEMHESHLQSNWDDTEGYYKAQIGEIIFDRYRTLGIVGKGVFSTVLKCADLNKPISDISNEINKKANANNISNTELRYEAVAIKMIRCNDTLKKAADKESLILSMITKNDANNKKYCIHLLDKFEYRNHTAFVFEYHSMNLREALKKFGKDVGINIGAIKLYMRQLFIALKYLLELRVVHADIKLDNILCSADLKQVRFHCLLRYDAF